MADNLKSCPFCGGEVRILTDMQDTTTPVYSVVCDECESITYFGDVLDKEGTVWAWNKRPSPWHTGTPTEEGWYLLHLKKDSKPYCVAYMDGRHWLGIDDFFILVDDVIEWHKIEPYKED